MRPLRTVLMLADDYACDPRNTARGRLYKDADRADDINRGVVVDYRTTDVTAANFLNVCPDPSHAFGPWVATRTKAAAELRLACTHRC
jgi:glycosylphosphatidylinositol transamidase (GPIT) subunit GPI8